MPYFRELQDRFMQNARVVLLGCNSGSGDEKLLSLVSHAFLRSVAGLNEEVKFDFEWAPALEVKDREKLICKRMLPNSRVTLRGRMMYSPAGNLVAGELGAEFTLGAFKMNAWALEPDSVSNDGDIFIPLRRKDPGMAATELAWRIIREFYEKHPLVAGTSFDQSSPGLRVRKRDKGLFIDVGPDYSRKTTPRTLKNRVAEMGQALQVVARKAEGVIPSK
jgi:hypothetical protein